MNRERLEEIEKQAREAVGVRFSQNDSTMTVPEGWVSFAIQAIPELVAAVRERDDEVKRLSNQRRRILKRKKRAARNLGSETEALRAKIEKLERVREAAEPIATFTNDHGPFGSHFEFIDKQKPFIASLRAALAAVKETE